MKGLPMLAALCVAVAAPAQTPEAGHPIRIWGPPAMQGIAGRWAEAYHRKHPDVSFTLTMRGSDTAIPGLYGGLADIALMGRENDVVDDNGFARTTQYPLVRIAIANGAVSGTGKSDAVAILASVDNPVKAISLDQLDAILNCEPKPGRSPVTRWGQLGLTGAWAGRAIHVYSIDLASRTGAFFQQVATHNGRKMCWPLVTEFGDTKTLDGTALSGADQVGQAARRDPSALAIANAAQAVDGLKVVPILDGGHPVSPDEATIVAEHYPLARRAYAYINRAPGRPTEPHVRAFLDWVLGEEGQALLKLDKGYLPLNEDRRRAQRIIVDGRP